MVVCESYGTVNSDFLLPCRPSLQEVEWGREVVAELIAHPVVFLLVHDETVDKDWQVRDVYGWCHDRKECEFITHMQHRKCFQR